MNRGLAFFISRLIRNENKELFLTRLGTTLILGEFNFAPWVSKIIDYFLRSVIGLLIEVGVYHIELTIDSYREGAKLKEFEAAAKAAYEKATAKVYDEDQKNQIRLEYLRLIALIGNVGNPK